MSNKSSVSGFSFIKHGLELGYPIKESVLSIEPLCDEIVINVGFDDPDLKKDDGTFEYLSDTLTSPKFKIMKSWWDPSLRTNGEILSQQTNIALSKCNGKYCQYIQGDEVIHEDDIVFIEDGLKKMEVDSEIQGLVFNYLHFYGNVDTYLYTRRMYRREIRFIRNHQGHISWKDAQGFKTKNHEKLKCKLIDARVFHYGWARAEKLMKKKVYNFEKLYHKDNKEKDFKYVRTWGQKKFLKSHPKIAKEWILKNQDDLAVMEFPYIFKFKDLDLILSDFFEELTGYRLGEYKNYKLIR